MEWRARKQEQQAARAAAEQRARQQAEEKQCQAWAAKVRASKQALQQKHARDVPQHTQQPAQSPPPRVSVSTMLSIAERNVALLDKRRIAMHTKQEAQQRTAARKAQLLAQAQAAVAPRVTADKARLLQPTMAFRQRQEDACPSVASLCCAPQESVCGGKALPSWRAGLLGSY